MEIRIRNFSRSNDTQRKELEKELITFQRKNPQVQGANIELETSFAKLKGLYENHPADRITFKVKSREDKQNGGAPQPSKAEERDVQKLIDAGADGRDMKAYGFAYWSRERMKVIFRGMEFRSYAALTEYLDSKRKGS